MKGVLGVDTSKWQGGDIPWAEVLSQTFGRRTVITIVSDRMVIVEFAIFPSQHSSRAQDAVTRVEAAPWQA